MAHASGIGMSDELRRTFAQEVMEGGGGKGLAWIRAVIQNGSYGACVIVCPMEQASKCDMPW